MEQRFGAFVLLDALGFRGVWSREDPSAFANKWETVVNRFQAYAGDILQAVNQPTVESRLHLLSPPGSEIDISAFSDTIALGVSGSNPVKCLYNATMLSILGFMGALRDGIFLRGAVSINPFFRNVAEPTGPALGSLVNSQNEVPQSSSRSQRIQGTILVGPAADDAAEWHNRADWIGVMLTPAAAYALDSMKPSDPVSQGELEILRRMGLRRCEIPLVKKDGVRGSGTALESYAVNWPKFFVTGGKSAIRNAILPDSSDYEEGERELMGLFAHGPIGLDVREKYEHTLDFFRECVGRRPSSVASGGKKSVG